MKMQCEMKHDCCNLVTHIGEKGYIYCVEHALARRQSGYERTRKMRPWEVRLIASGQPLPSYRLLAQPKVSATVADSHL